MDRLWIVISGVLAMSPGVSAATPNLVVILADDMGYGDVHAFNPASQIPTPHLDGLAQAGMTFTDAHSPSAVCTPTRYGLLTGRYCWRSSLKRGVLNGYSGALIERDRPTVASLLAAQNYVTGIVGKWHLGLNWVRLAGTQEIDFEQPVTHGPNDLGFQYSFIIPASLDFPPYVYLRNGRVTEARTVDQPAQKFPAFLRHGPRSEALVMTDCLDDLTEQAVQFIRDHAADDQPFFLYFPLSAPHKPVLPHPRFRGRTELGPYADFIVQVDDTVGKVLGALDESNVSENTLVIYSSDNGSYMYRRSGKDHVEDETIQAYRAEHHKANGVLRGTKADVWEAGHRVPFMARWPEQIRPGSSCDATVCLVDILATAAEIVGAEKPESAQDSFSMLPLMRGQPEHHRPPVIHHSGSGMFAIRKGEWKLVLGNGSGGREKPTGKPFARPYRLFNLNNDLPETTDLLQQHPDVAESLEKQCLQIIGDDR